MEVKMNRTKQYWAHKGGLYREVAFLKGGHYKQVSLYEVLRNPHVPNKHIFICPVHIHARTTP